MIVTGRTDVLQQPRCGVAVVAVAVETCGISRLRQLDYNDRNEITDDADTPCSQACSCDNDGEAALPCPSIVSNCPPELPKVCRISKLIWSNLYRVVHLSVFFLTVFAQHAQSQ